MDFISGLYIRVCCAGTQVRMTDVIANNISVRRLFDVNLIVI